MNNILSQSIYNYLRRTLSLKDRDRKLDDVREGSKKKGGDEAGESETLVHVVLPRSVDLCRVCSAKVMVKGDATNNVKPGEARYETRGKWSKNKSRTYVQEETSSTTLTVVLSCHSLHSAMND